MELEILSLQQENGLLKQEMESTAQKVAELKQRFIDKNVECDALSSLKGMKLEEITNFSFFRASILAKIHKLLCEKGDLKDNLKVADKLHVSLSQSLEDAKEENQRLKAEIFEKTIVPLKKEIAQLLQVVELMRSDLVNGFDAMELVKEEFDHILFCLFEYCKECRGLKGWFSGEFDENFRAIEEMLSLYQKKLEELDKREKEMGAEVLLKNEEKREAIRQLSLDSEYYRENFNHLRQKLPKKMKLWPFMLCCCRTLSPDSDDELAPLPRLT